jgi:hypothetical protein
MALSFPLALPFERFVSTRFRIVPLVAKTRTGAASFAREIGPAYWSAEVSTPPHTPEELYRWLAFFDALRGGAKSFLLFDAGRLAPFAHPTHTGTANLSAITNPRQVSINGLPAAFKMTAGDYIGFERTGRYSLHRVVQDATASAGGVAAVSFEPPLAAHFQTGSLVRLNKPKGEFVLDSHEATRGLLPSPVSFSATSRAF